MSFSEQVKEEILKTENTTPEQVRADFYGRMLLGGEFGSVSIVMHTGSFVVASRTAQLLADEVGVMTEVSHPLGRSHSGKGFVYTLTVPDKEDRRRVLEYFGHHINEMGIRIQKQILQGEGCISAFLRGAFLAGGSISDPMKSYRIEFCLPYQKLSESLAELLSDLPGISFHPKVTVRKGTYIVYLKISEEITDLLTYMGAVNSSMEYMQIKMLKEVRNDVNRRTNFDTANIDKTVSASAEQENAIAYLKNKGILEKLSEELQLVARAREEHPEMSLRELEEYLQHRVSRSGINHRLQKLVLLAKEHGLRQEE